MRVRVALTPDEPSRFFAAPPAGWPRDARACTGVAVDVLRATSTLAAAFQNGAVRVIPAATPDEARALAQAHAGALLCGERDGRRIEGFALGNSPSEYGPDVVRGRTLVFASTNGSLALRAIAGCGRRWIAAFVNATAAARALAGASFVLVVCAGKLGRFALEDAAFAGGLCATLEEEGARLEGEAARLVRALAPRDAGEVRALVQGVSHGRYLRRLGGEFARDVEWCARLDAIGQAFEV